MFSVYFKLGLQHILDINGYDHIVFVIALCAIYTLKQWRAVALMVTAFTIGHSLTLTLAIFDIITFSSELIETLIPITILITCIYNIVSKPTLELKKWQLNYWLALLFGFIHGMGFSNFLRSAMMPGQQSIAKQLFAFNIGLEIGQLIIVAFILGLSYIAIELCKMKQREWVLFVSGIAFGIAIIILLG